VKFLVDAQLPKTLATLLGKAGHECRHTLDLPEGNRTTDSAIRALADKEGFVVVTKDSDFVDSHLLTASPSKLLLISTGNISNRQLLEMVEKHWPSISSALADSSFVELSQGGLVVH